MTGRTRIISQSGSGVGTALIPEGKKKRKICPRRVSRVEHTWWVETSRADAATGTSRKPQKKAAVRWRRAVASPADASLHLFFLFSCGDSWRRRSTSLLLSNYLSLTIFLPDSDGKRKRKRDPELCGIRVCWRKEKEEEEEENNTW